MQSHFAIRYTLPSIGLALCVLLGLAATAVAEQDPPLRDLLMSVPRDFDHGNFTPDISFTGNRGLEKLGVRCATRPVGELEKELISGAVDEFITSAGADHRQARVTIPVYFHVVRNGNGAWNVANRRIRRQLRVLNRAYAGKGFSFTLKGVRRYRDSTFAKKCLRESVESSFKRRNAVDPRRTLNVYTCRPGQGVLGYAYFPSDYREDSHMHGVVLLHSSLPGGRAAPFNLGDTLTHEVGHYLGLFHTFEGGCGRKGDRVSDTPAERRPADGCPLRRNSCPAPGRDPVRNFMDYSDDSCMEQFTGGQSRRMKDQVATFRPSL